MSLCGNNNPCPDLITGQKCGITYTGARYVPLFADPAQWDNTKAYEPLTIVLNEGNSYTSKTFVPVGVDISNEMYWALTGNYNAQVEAYRQEVQNFINTFKKNEIIYAVDYGITKDNPNIVEAMGNLVSYVNARKGNCTIVFPSVEVHYKPNLGGNLFRELIEFLDVDNVIIEGNNCTIVQDNDPSWNTEINVNGNSDPEGIIQFRSSTQYSCSNIVIKNLKLIGSNIPYTTGYDGNIFGIALKGVDGAIIDNCSCLSWATDGIYLGSTYNNAFLGKNIRVSNTICNGNKRNGCSIMCDNVYITESSFINTSGGSFQFGIDIEPNDNKICENIQLNKCLFSGNVAGSLNAIRCNDVNISECLMDEPTNCFISDGTVNNLNFINNNCRSSNSVIYLRGTNLSNFKILNNYLNSTNIPNSFSIIRMLNSALIDKIFIKNNILEGSGGLAIYSNRCNIEGNIFLLHQINGVGFTINVVSNKNTYINNSIIVDSEVSCTPLFVMSGETLFSNNTIESNPNCVFILTKNENNKYNFRYNEFNENFIVHYDNQIINSAGVLTESFPSESSYRLVNGGYKNTQNTTDAKLGDISFSITDAGDIYLYYCTAPSSTELPHGTWKNFKLNPA